MLGNHFRHFPLAKCVVLLLFGVLLHSGAFGQNAPGTFADANNPSGAPDPEKLDQIWQVDPISGQVSISISFNSTPQGGRGPKIPFKLIYNSGSTLSPQANAGGIYGWYTHPLASNVLGPSGPWVTSGMYITMGSSGESDINLNNPLTSSFLTGCAITGPINYTDETGSTHDLGLLNTQYNDGGLGSQGSEGPTPDCGNSWAASLWPNSLTNDGSAMATSSSGRFAVGPDGTYFTATTTEYPGTSGYNSYNHGGTLTDSNGNTAVETVNGGVTTVTDSLGRTVFTTNIPIGLPGQIPAGTYSVNTWNAAGTEEIYTVTFATQTIGSFTMPHPTNSDIECSVSCPANKGQMVVGQPNGDSFTAITSIVFPALSNPPMPLAMIPSMGQYRRYPSQLEGTRVSLGRLSPKAGHRPG